jgi:hypothetical protein
MSRVGSWLGRAAGGASVIAAAGGATVLSMVGGGPATSGRSGAFQAQDRDNRVPTGLLRAPEHSTAVSVLSRDSGGEYMPAVAACTTFAHCTGDSEISIIE